MTQQEIDETLTLFRTQATIVPLTVHVAGVATHPEDDLVLATALSAGAAYLVTGDKELRALGSYQGVTIPTPREFLDLLDRQDDQDLP